MLFIYILPHYWVQKESTNLPFLANPVVFQCVFPHVENTHQGTLGWRREGEHMEYFGGFKEKKNQIICIETPKGKEEKQKRLNQQPKLINTRGKSTLPRVFMPTSWDCAERPCGGCRCCTQCQADTAVFLETTRFIYLVQMAQKHLGGNSPLTFYTSHRVLGHLSLDETASSEDLVGTRRMPPLQGATSSLGSECPNR